MNAYKTKYYSSTDYCAVDCKKDKYRIYKEPVKISKHHHNHSVHHYHDGHCCNHQH